MKLSTFLSSCFHSLIFFSVFSERVEHPYISDFQERNEECTFSDIAGAWTETG